jgi:hypothetical protein
LARRNNDVRTVVTSRGRLRQREEDGKADGAYDAKMLVQCSRICAVTLRVALHSTRPT